MIRKRSGANWRRKSCTGSRSGRRRSTGNRPSRSGSSAARSTPPTTASTGTSTPPQEQGRHHLGGRAGRSAHPHLSGAAPRGVALRQRAEIARLQGRRPRHHLHADGSRAAHRAAGLRAAGHHPLGGLRRLLRRKRSRCASRIWTPPWSSRPMAAGGAAKRSSSRPPSMRRCSKCPGVRDVIVYRRTGSDIRP